MSSRPSLPALIAALCACAAAACNAAGVDPKGDPDPPAGAGAADFAWDARTFRAHADEASGLRFDVPATGYAVRAEHFDRSTPPVKMKDAISLLEGRREVVRVEAWHNTEKLDLRAWFAKYLGFMATPDATVQDARAGRTGAASIVVRHPRSVQAQARRHAIVALYDRVVRVSCQDDGDLRARAIFDRIVAGIDAEVGR